MTEKQYTMAVAEGVEDDNMKCIIRHLRRARNKLRDLHERNYE